MATKMVAAWSADDDDDDDDDDGEDGDNKLALYCTCFV